MSVGEWLEDVMCGKPAKAHAVKSMPSGFPCATVRRARRSRVWRGSTVAPRIFAGLPAYALLTVGLLTLASIPARAGSFPATVKLSDLNAHKGVAVRIGQVTHVGISVSGAGDVNGDGIDDFIVGSREAPVATSTESKRGYSYVVFGKADGMGGEVDLLSLDGSNGFRVNGLPGDGAHSRVSKAGDVNGDGIGDVVACGDITGPYFFAGTHPVSTGRCYVIFGRNGDFGMDLDVSALNGTNGFVLNARTPGENGEIAVSDAGDVNGDGMDDLIFGVSRSASDLVSDTGAAYVIFGKSTPFAASIDLWMLDGSDGFVLNGVAPGDGAGSAVSGVGDVNADGVDDLLIGAFGEDATIGGAAYVVFGKTSSFASTLELSNLNGDDGFRLNVQNGRVGSVGAAGDVNNDGISDLLLGGTDTFVVFGASSGFEPWLDLSSLNNLNSVNGFMVKGNSDSVSGVGDVNGDGIDDLLIGNSATVFFAGRACVVYGTDAGFDTPLDCDTLNGSNGFVMSGVAANDRAGYSVRGVGDVNADGLNDLIVGAPGFPSRATRGKTYVVYGRRDLDGDGMSDTWESANKLDPKLDDSAGDADADGLSNLHEYNGNTNPQKQDTDGDGVPDGVDPFPTRVFRPKYDFDGNGISDFPWHRPNGLFVPNFVQSLVPITSTYGVRITYSAPAQDSGFFDTFMPTPWSVEAIDDFDGDGRKADVLWRNTNTGATVIWFVNDGAITYFSDVIRVPRNFVIAGSGDFDGDRRADILWRNTTNGGMSIWFMDGPRVSDTRYVAAVPAPFGVAAVDDFNGDGRADILWYNLENGNAVIWLMLGNSIRARGPAPSYGDATIQVQATGDFNGDGRADILYRDSSGALIYWLMDGLLAIGSMELGGRYAAPLRFQVKAAGDYNGDGTDDILWDNNGKLSVWFMRKHSHLPLSFVVRTAVVGVTQAGTVEP